MGVDLKHHWPTQEGPKFIYVYNYVSTTAKPRLVGNICRGDLYLYLRALTVFRAQYCSGISQGIPTDKTSQGHAEELRG